MAGTVDQQFQLLAKEFTQATETSALVEKVGPVPGASSMFNPFNLFRYSKYGLNQNDYRANLHFDKGGELSDADTIALMGVNVNPFATPEDQNAANNSSGSQAGAQEGSESTSKSSAIGELKSFVDTRRFIENPTATNIIEWSQREATAGARTAKGPTPYSASDFLYCSLYGKVPNNRLVTLRRYPIPVEDNLTISAVKTPLVPIAQAVTWYGQDIDNPLNSILNLSWGLNWTSDSAKVQDIQGNEITVDELIAALPFEVDEKVAQVLKTQIFSGGKPVDILKLSGYDVNAQDYIKNAYSAEGPYWNRVLGPVNVIDSTYRRDRGFVDNKTNPVTLNFKYSLRSFNGLNPKMVFLDLITNFLSLTYNTAPFWGGGARYFQQTGVTLPALRMEQKFFEGDMLGAIQTGVEELSQLASARLNELISLAEDALAATGGDAENETALNEYINPRKENIDAATERAQRGGNAGPVEKALAPRLGRLLRKPLLYRSLLDGRAVGEWHVTVGNPMNPIAMMGNLCLDKVTVNFSDTLGIDDFPTEVTFKVTLKHGRPRAKQDLESIFNLGNGAMSFTPLPPPSSASNSYGEANTARLNAAFDGVPLNPDSAAAAGQGAGIVEAGTSANQLTAISNNSPNQSAANASSTLNNAGGGPSMEEISKLADSYRSRVSSFYGEGYGRSPILQDYFVQLKTKD